MVTTSIFLPAYRNGLNYSANVLIVGRIGNVPEPGPSCWVDWQGGRGAPSQLDYAFCVGTKQPIGRFFD